MGKKIQRPIPRRSSRAKKPKQGGAGDIAATSRPRPFDEYQRKLIDSASELGLGIYAVQEFAFHMTDWLSDVQKLVRLIRSPSRYSNAEATDIVMRFVGHAPNHLAAAHKILYDSPISDVFELGAVKGTGVPRRKPGTAYKASNGSRPSAKPGRKSKKPPP